MNITIVYAHPYDGSFNHAILERVAATLEKKHSVDIIDLYKDGFDPIIKKEELAVYSEGKYFDENVKKYQEKLNKTEHLMLIFPIWWTEAPAIMKGFFEKVLLKSWAYLSSEGKFPEGLLTHISGATVITTMSGPGFYYNLIVGNPLKGSVVKGTLKFCGIKKVKVIKVPSVTTAGNEKRGKWLDKIEKYAAKL